MTVATKWQTIQLIKCLKTRVTTYEDEYQSGWQKYWAIQVVIWHPSLRTAQKKIVLYLASNFTAQNIIHHRSSHSPHRDRHVTKQGFRSAIPLGIFWSKMSSFLPGNKDKNISLFTVLISNVAVTKMCSIKLCNYFTSVMKGTATFVTNLVLCCVTLIWFPEDGPLRSETCRNNQSQILIQTLWERGWALFCIVSWNNDR